MTTETTYTVTLTRREMLDIRMALLAARHCSNTSGSAYMELRDKLVHLMAEQDDAN